MPRLSIGLPIYNGANFGEYAITSLLDQTFDDFELIIADNASTDRTEQICREYAAQDDRIRYFRHEKNMGAAYNFNFTFHQAESEYFKWASHDDVLAPRYLARCVETLDNNPEIVLCHTLTDLIDDQGKHLEDDHRPMRLDSQQSHKRFRDLSVIRHDCVLVFGVVRHKVLEQTPKIGNYVGSDRVLLCELALRGKLCEVPEHLFSRRRHKDTSCSLPERKERAAWFDPSQAGVVTYPNWRILRECVGAIRRVPQPGQEKSRCYMQILEHIWVRKGFLVTDLVEGLKLLIKRSKLGHRLYYFLKRMLKPSSVK